VFGESAIFKVFRRVAAGPNPDLEVAAALAELGSTHIAEPFGWVETRIDGATTVLAILSRYLRAASDGWSLAATSVRDLYATEEGTRAAEAGGGFAGEAERLGAATAQVHRDLAPAFCRPRLQPAAPRAGWAGRRKGPAPHPGPWQGCASRCRPSGCTATTTWARSCGPRPAGSCST